MNAHVQKWAVGTLCLLAVLGTSVENVRDVGAEEVTRAALRSHPYDPTHMRVEGPHRYLEIWGTKLLKMLSLTEAGFNACAIEEALIRAKGDVMQVNYDDVMMRQMSLEAANGMGSHG